MGNTFEVSSWERISENRLDDYAYVVKYQGEDMAKALEVMSQLKKDGAGCVRLEWRGEFQDDN